jgi:hypothetical protein
MRWVVEEGKKKEPPCLDWLGKYSFDLPVKKDQGDGPKKKKGKEKVKRGLSFAVSPVGSWIDSSLISVHSSNSAISEEPKPLAGNPAGKPYVLLRWAVS